ncbi:hypothetical protein NLJ89_g1896 [Agrocybe chaxingu]|uniref:Transmembrane protein n=1 Tax=Agrocybe chaxingu TaxID=84603 RepID=A0A9W8MZ61_9AGAR|nr:hypothetical protein NLJ89_g1896 [Agrocybe chaxingu]
MSAARPRIVVDDTDTSQLRYEGEWVADASGINDRAGNFGPALNSTLHGVFNGVGGFEFEFSGSEIDVFGTTLNRDRNARRQDPTWDCFVDGVAIEKIGFDFIENNWVMCTVQNLSDGPHILTVNATSRGRPFWFDYVRYLPSAGVSLDNALVYVNDTNPSVQYDSNWQPLGDVGQMTSVQGAKVMFQFRGTGLTWIGVTPRELPLEPSIGSYSIDGGNSTAFALQGLAEGATTQYHQIVFKTPRLTDDTHTITVTYEGARNTTPLVLSHLFVQTGSSPVLSTSISSQSLPFPPSPSSSEISITAATSIPTPAAASASASRKINVAAVVGGVIGAILLILIAFFLYRYLKRARPRPVPASHEFIHTVPTPFMLVSERSTPNNNSTASLRGYGAASQQWSTGYIPQPYTEQPYGWRNIPSTSRLVNEGPSRPGPSRRGAISDGSESEGPSYYGGYQTWGHTKAQEGLVEGRPRDSYI